eukprot:CAMPEP_0177785374 /NCGR_PEP_ID=MMETSP0491_2-20121128/20281_1 /TAXON_ID=63592 /ORGANISM="Tetraselmis chuii, Strain PLY429" /LENGTH=71 /DNA_ID=CAMNT_0019306365 /DNA_START=199 /DNA_END=414 /DNA_ORIENTATION=+
MSAGLSVVPSVAEESHIHKLSGVAAAAMMQCRASRGKLHTPTSSCSSSATDVPSPRDRRVDAISNRVRTAT